MNPLQQYIDLYREHRGLIDANGADPLNRMRADACRALENGTLPRRGSDLFKNINLGQLLAPDFGINLDRVNIDVNPADTFRCDVPVLAAPLMLCINDTPTPTEHAVLPEGVEFCSLRTWALDYPHEAEHFYGRLASLSNPLVALNTLLCQDGVLLRVRKGVRLERPLQIVQILSHAKPLMAVRRLIVIVEDGADASLIVCDHSQRKDIDYLALQTVEVFVGTDARLSLCGLEESTETTTRLASFYIDQGARSEVTVNAITLFNGTTRNEFFCRFSGEEARLRLYGMGIEDGERTLSNYSLIEHNVPRCNSDELFKYSVDGEATAAFAGRIYVAPGAIGTEAYQSNRNLLASNTAKVYTQPVLEIYNDDVKCSHGAAIGQLDELQLFYMRTRGISEETARLMLRQAFMSDVINSVQSPALRDRLHLLVERRFAGADSACASCRNCNPDNTLD